MEKAPGSEQSLEEPVGIWAGSGESELQTPGGSQGIQPGPASATN